MVIFGLAAAWFEPTVVSVRDFGARGNGQTDDRPAIQAAIDALAYKGGGTLRVPRGTYLLDSYLPSPHPWFFYNLRAGSNIAIVGEEGAKLLQGPHGRAPVGAVPGATTVMNSVLVFGSKNFVSNTFQDPAANGGFIPLAAVKEGYHMLTPLRPADQNRIRPGDHVVVYESDPTDRDVVPSQGLDVVSASNSIGLDRPVLRAADRPVAAIVTRLATTNDRIEKLTIQGAVPLNVNEVIGFVARDCSLVFDSQVGGSNIVGLVMNDIRGCLLEHDRFSATGSPVSLELPQRDSADVEVRNNNFDVRSMGFGEYGAHWLIKGNTIHLHNADLATGPGLFFGGRDVLFEKNLVTGFAGEVPMVADWIGTDAYAPYVSGIRIVGNRFVCSAKGGNCLNAAGQDTLVQDNHFAVTGQAGEAVLIEGSLPQTVSVVSNEIDVQGDFGIVVNPPPGSHPTVHGNRVAGRGLSAIYLTPRQRPGSSTIRDNQVEGFLKRPG